MGTWREEESGMWSYIPDPPKDIDLSNRRFIWDEDDITDELTGMQYVDFGGLIFFFKNGARVALVDPRIKLVSEENEFQTFQICGEAIEAQPWK